ncbi:MAG: LytTR family transcriptional regulator DNA-binding domain-containing protein [Atopobiaceae bacterium]
MKGTLSETALRTSEEIVRALWRQDPESCRPYLHESFTYIGPNADEYCLTLQTLDGYFGRMPKDGIEAKKISEEYFQVRAQGAHGMLVTGHVLASYPTGPHEVAFHRFRVTLLWTYEDDKLLLVHLHISTPTWQSHGQKTMHEQEGTTGAVAVRLHPHSHPLVMRDSSGVAHFLDADSVIYLEAERQYTMVHTTEGIFRLAKVLGKVASELPPTFLRVHRGFVINVAHVREIHTRQIILDEGTAIPMPERRSVQVRKEVEEAIGALGKA